MSSIKLIIRCAHLANADLIIDEAKTDWTVRQLKVYLADVHPSKPAPERQRIVFAGQLLRDEARLSDYFGRYDASEPFVLHLVYTVGIDENVAVAQSRAKQQETELRQRKIAQNAPTTSTDQNRESAPPMPVNSENPAAQYWPWLGGQQYQVSANPDITNEWIRQQQQMYATMNAMMSQWYGQYMQAYGGGAAFYPSWSAQPAVGSPWIDQQQQPQAEPVVQAQQEVPRAQQQPVMNAQGGAAAVDMDEDDPRNRDWLDYIYMACRASFLMMILYFYSSIERFVFVMLCCTLMYGLQAGWFGRRGQQQQDVQARRPAAPDGRAPAIRNQQQNEMNPAAGQNNEAEGQGADVRAPVDPEMPMTAWNVFWTTCWTFISSFFASLVPERPPPLNM